MFGIGPTELIFFLVILLLVVGPEKLPTFMRTVGKGVRQVRNASREFKEAIGLDELMREGDPFRSPPVRQPKERPVPVQTKAQAEVEARGETSAAPGSHSKPTTPPPLKSSSPPVPPASDAAQAIRRASDTPPSADTEVSGEPDAPTGTGHP